ncbi:MAG: hypothetical protein U0U67_04605 [Chitinophagales bacterium]
MKRIDALKKENKLILDSLSKQNKILNLVKDTLLKMKEHPFMICSDIFKSYVAISKPNAQIIKLNYTYKNKIYLVESNSATDHFLLEYSIPTRERNFNKEMPNIAKFGSKPLEHSGFSTLEFTPNEIGWYYWNGNILLRNERTAEITKYPIIDSFYVYK